MGKPSPTIRGGRLARDQRGQAVVEYILMVLFAISCVSIIGIGFRKTLFKLWTGMTRDVAAACPGCPPDPKIKFQGH